MPRATALGLALVLVTPVALPAQASSELGTTLGLVVLHQTASITYITGPGGGMLANPTLYYTYFSARGPLIEPQLGFTFVSSSGGTARRILLALQIGTLQHPAARGSTYAAVNIGLISADGGGSGSTAFAIGAAGGYRARVGRGLAVRGEARYRRWLGYLDGLNEYGLVLGIAGII